MSPSLRREFQLVNTSDRHAAVNVQNVNNSINRQRNQRNVHNNKRASVSIWGISNTLNRLWVKRGQNGFSGFGGRVSKKRRRQSFHAGHGLTTDDESDYAYIDRSTHSITGYLNNR